MNELNIEKKVIIFLLLNKNNSFSDAYSLIKTLSAWFNIINYNELLMELIKDGFIEKVEKNQLGYYSLNKETIELFERSKSITINQIREVYNNRINTINTLAENMVA
jgi:hypothetical protein